ncbi:MAG: hypothetical protein ABIF87_08085 [Pseudomonadota bacterium]
MPWTVDVVFDGRLDFRLFVQSEYDVTPFVISLRLYGGLNIFPQKDPFFLVGFSIFCGDPRLSLAPAAVEWFI